MTLHTWWEMFSYGLIVGTMLSLFSLIWADRRLNRRQVSRPLAPAKEPKPKQ